MSPPAPPINAARRLLLVHSHPDDESITTGGTIARYAAAPDTHVTLVTCTLGEEGEVMRPELAGLVAARAGQLGQPVAAELAAACAALGCVDQRFLGGVGRWRDSGMVSGHGALAAAPPPESLHPRAFSADAERAGQIAALAAIMDEVRPQVVIGYDPRGGYGHPDHVRAHEITMAAAADQESVRKVYWTVASRFDVEAGLAELAAAGRTVAGRIGDGRIGDGRIGDGRIGDGRIGDGRTGAGRTGGERTAAGRTGGERTAAGRNRAGLTGGERAGDGPAAARTLPWRVAGPDELASVADSSVTARIDVRAQLPAKLAALRAHATQLTVWQHGPLAAFALTNEIAQPVPAAECYTLVGAARSVRAGETEVDLFEGIEVDT